MPNLYEYFWPKNLGAARIIANPFENTGNKQKSRPLSTLQESTKNSL